MVDRETSGRLNMVWPRFLGLPPTSSGYFNYVAPQMWGPDRENLLFIYIYLHLLYNFIYFIQKVGHIMLKCFPTRWPILCIKMPFTMSNKLTCNPHHFTINIYYRLDGQKVDKILASQNITCIWSTLQIENLQSFRNHAKLQKII